MIQNVIIMLKKYVDSMGAGRKGIRNRGEDDILAFLFAGEPLKGDMLNGRIQDGYYTDPLTYILTR